MTVTYECPSYEKFAFYEKQRAEKPGNRSDGVAREFPKMAPFPGRARRPKSTYFTACNLNSVHFFKSGSAAEKGGGTTTLSRGKKCKILNMAIEATWSNWQLDYLPGRMMHQ